MRPIDANALMERLTRKKADVANQRYTEGFNDALLKFRSMLHSEPTLDCATVRHYGATSFVTTEDIDKYNSRIVLDEGGKSRFCRIFYEDGETDTPKWISVKDRLPTGEDPVLILVKETEHYGYNKEKRKVYYCQYLAYWDGDEWFTTWCNGCRKISDTAKEPYADDYEVTHWMPLPEAPKEDEEK